MLPKRTPPKSANHHKSSPERPPCYHGAMFFGVVVTSPWPVDVRQTSTSRIWCLTWCQFLLPGRPTYRLKCYSAAAQNRPGILARSPGIHSLSNLHYNYFPNQIRPPWSRTWANRRPSRRSEGYPVPTWSKERLIEVPSPPGGRGYPPRGAPPGGYPRPPYRRVSLPSPGGYPRPSRGGAKGHNGFRRLPGPPKAPQAVPPRPSHRTVVFRGFGEGSGCQLASAVRRRGSVTDGGAQRRPPLMCFPLINIFDWPPLLLAKLGPGANQLTIFHCGLGGGVTPRTYSCK